jgi:CRISPR/Cas system-associated exonuclease Cas4 (RecB family)
MIDFNALQTEELQKRIKVWPKYTYRASDLGHECGRYHYLSIENWKDRMPHDPVLQSIFDVGNVFEEHLAVPRINKMRGIRIIEQQIEHIIPSPRITMHLDGRLLVEETNEYIDDPVGTKIPFEVKTVTPWDFAKLNSLEDFTHSKKHHQRMYVAQLQLYLLGTGCEWGYMVLVNKITGMLKFIRATIDIDFCDALIKKAERSEEAREAQIPPERINDFDICSGCAFRHVCLPEISNTGVQIMDEAEMAEKLKERDTLKDSMARFRELDNEIKTSMKGEGEGQYIVEDFVLKVSKKRRGEYKVEASEWLETRIARLK